MTPKEREVVEADYTWIDGAFRADVQVAVTPDGRIEAAGALGETPTRRLAGRALLPGFVDAHSHAFQRGLRGQGESFPAGAGDFWSWRDAMFELVESLDGERFYRLTLQAFREMRSAGITSVGEFHYFHHDRGGDDWAFDRLVLRAAALAGIRLVLLQTYYRTGGIDREPAGGQLRFRTPGLDAYWEQLARLEEWRDAKTQTLGVVAHSVRAAGLDEIVALYDEARRRGLPFHMHVEEQRREIEAAVARYGDRPLALLNQRLGSCAGFTAVHCTHSDPEELERFASRGGAVCLCPLTEANLGDGIPASSALVGNGSGLCLGTDSNARISMLEEMRWAEYGQRLRGETRGVVRDGEGSVARPLLAAATIGGARALGIEAGEIAAGRWADFAVIDLEHPSLADWTPATLLDAIVFGTGNEIIAATAVAGAWLERDRGLRR